MEKLFTEWIITETSEIIPFQEKIEKNWKNRVAIVTRKRISREDGTMLVPETFPLFWCTKGIYCI